MKHAPSCLIIAGEKSGEEHALSFFDQLKKDCPDVDFYGVGGDDLKLRGVELLYSLSDFSSWGISGVIGKIPFYKKAMRRLEEEVERRQTKVAILIDFQTFNMKLAKRLKERGVKILYYVAPQAWAWKAYRTKALAQDTDVLFTILPFEKKWFSDRGVSQVTGAIHPLALRLRPNQSLKPRSYTREDEIKLLLLPGSRAFEVSSLLADFNQAVSLLRAQGLKVKVGLVTSRSLDPLLYQSFSLKLDQSWSDEELEQALEWADFSLAASGTVTLACALKEVPTIVSYRTSLLNEFIFFTFVNYEGAISLANIVHEEMVFPELTQDHVSAYNLSRALLKWIDDTQELIKLKDKLAQTRDLLTGDIIPSHEVMAKIIRRAYEPAN